MIRFFKIVVRILLVLVMFPVAGFIMVYANYHFISFAVKNRVYESAKTVPARNTALVMGAGNYKPRSWTNHTFNHRIKTTLELYATRKVDTIITSGMRLSADVDEVSDMQFVLTENGIPASILKADREGNRTWASVTNSYLKAGVDSIIIISQHGQLERALFIAWCIGQDAVGLASEPIPPRHRYWVVREYLARVKCVFDCVAYKLNLN